MRLIKPAEARITMKKIYSNDVEHAARKALITINSEYFGWDQERQERFRATVGEDDSERIQEVIWKSLFNKQYSEEENDELSPFEKALENCAYLQIYGIGQDFIYLNECLPDDQSLLDFPTLYDYRDYLFQEESRKEADKQYSGMPYYPFRFSPWIRLFIDQQFYYGSCLSAASHVIDELNVMGREVIQTLVPHDYVDGDENGKSTDGGTIWDIKLDAGGQEGQLEELQCRWRNYTNNLWLALSEQCSSLPPAVYIDEPEIDSDDGAHRLFIFNNQAALKQTRWKYFLADISLLQQEDDSFISDLISYETERANLFLQSEHKDIMQNFDPNVIKFKKKMTVVIAPGALDDL